MLIVQFRLVQFIDTQAYQRWASLNQHSMKY